MNTQCLGGVTYLDLPSSIPLPPILDALLI